MKMNSQLKPVDLLGLIGIGVGLLLLVAGIAIGGEIGGMARALGGLLLLGGLGAVILVRPGGRAKVLGIFTWYWKTSAGLNCGYKVSLALAMVAMLMFALYIVMGIAFGFSVSSGFIVMGIVFLVLCVPFVVCGMISEAQSSDEPSRTSSGRYGRR